MWIEKLKFRLSNSENNAFFPLVLTHSKINTSARHTSIFKRRNLINVMCYLWNKLFFFSFSQILPQPNWEIHPRVSVRKVCRKSKVEWKALIVRDICRAVWLTHLLGLKKKSLSHLTLSCFFSKLKLLLACVCLFFVFVIFVIHNFNYVHIIGIVDHPLCFHLLADR